MPEVNKETANQRAARVKAQRQRVYISGLEGHHSLETGVAYHYRGHFIYACPAGNPIEPIPFSTRKGISIVGTVQERAPLYDPKAGNLVLEGSIAALHRSRLHEQEHQQQREEDKKKEVAQALEQEKATKQAENAVDSVKQTSAPPTLASGAHEPSHSHPPRRVASCTLFPPLSRSTSRVHSHTSLASLASPDRRLAASSSDILQIGAIQAPSMPSVTAYAPQTISSRQSYTPHDRAQFLASSAPGSRHVSATNTPYTSRPVSPTHGHGVRSSLRPIASTSRLTRLLADEGMRRAISPLLEVSEGRASRAADGGLADEFLANLSTEYLEPEDIAAFIQTVSRPPSRAFLPPSRPVSRPHSPTPLVAAEQPNTHFYFSGLEHKDSPRSLSRMVQPTPPDNSSNNNNIGNGRPRQASIALNVAYNAANPPRTEQQVSNVERADPRNGSTAAHSLSSGPPTNGTAAPRETTNGMVQACSIHDETCDGVTVTNQHQTQRAREGPGFVEEYPMIAGGDGRVMVDWLRLLQEEKARGDF